MEIIRGGLDDISRPASIEQTGRCVSLPHSDRSGPTAPFSLVVLTSDAADIQSSSEETIINSSARDPDKSQCHIEVTDEEKEDAELQRAIEEMRRLDEILSAKIRKEKEVKCQRKELQAKLWQELLQNKPEGHSECAQETMNTRLFLALEAPTGTEEEEDDFVPVFETQVPDWEHNRDRQNLEQSEERPDSSSESFEPGHEETGEEQFEGSHCGASKGKKQQKDFVKRNIELIRGEGDHVPLTQAEKERLAELLRDVDEEEEDSAKGADTEEDMWAVSVRTGQGYTPELSDLQRLIDIDSKIRLLLPVEEFLSVQSSYTHLSMAQALVLGLGPLVDVSSVSHLRTLSHCILKGQMALLIICVACQWKIVFFEVIKTLQHSFANPGCLFLLPLLDVDEEKLQYLNPSAGIAHDQCHNVWNIYVAGLIISQFPAAFCVADFAQLVQNCDITGQLDVLLCVTISPPFPPFNHRAWLKEFF
ncbi:fibrous sheath-interacting protein 1 isoform X3 [Sebastes umbrosus]|nr:fibrous sheath-interacting protein 1 isoform X3 [Sebastes umbrosus]